jgi:hypothetical protein
MLAVVDCSQRCKHSFFINDRFGVKQLIFLGFVYGKKIIFENIQEKGSEKMSNVIHVEIRVKSYS